MSDLVWTTTQQLADANGVKLLVYGKSGVGKTQLCATAPRPIILAAEPRVLSLRGYAIPVQRVESLAKLAQVYQWCASPTNWPHFDTICIDSLTEIADVLLAGLKVGAKDQRAVQRAYGDMLDQMLGWVRAFRDLPKHVYMSAKQERSKDEATGIMLYQPAMPGQKLGPQLPYMFDEVFAMRIERDAQGAPVHFLQTHADSQYDGKDVSGRLAVYEQPDLTAIIHKIIGHV
jgi:hypothetical protein